jgi:poly(3-hydroxybutyrate) depolymerase
VGDKKMNSERKVLVLAAVAFAVLAVPMSADAAQQTKRVSVRTASASRVYLLETPSANTNAAENFQNRFQIDY